MLDAFLFLLVRFNACIRLSAHMYTQVMDHSRTYIFFGRKSSHVVVKTLFCRTYALSSPTSRIDTLVLKPKKIAVLYFIRLPSVWRSHKVQCAQQRIGPVLSSSLKLAKLPCLCWIFSSKTDWLSDFRGSRPDLGTPSTYGFPFSAPNSNGFLSGFLAPFTIGSRCVLWVRIAVVCGCLLRGGGATGSFGRVAS